MHLQSLALLADELLILRQARPLQPDPRRAGFFSAAALLRRKSQSPAPASPHTLQPRIEAGLQAPSLA